MMPHGLVHLGCRLSVASAFLGGLGLSAATAATYTPLHVYSGGADGAFANSALVPDEFGNAYGTTQGGGSFCVTNPYGGCGTLFKIDAAGVLTTLYRFTGVAGDVASPGTGLTSSRGNLYGAAASGGQFGFGGIFSLKPDGSGYTVFHNFNGVDGNEPTGQLQPGADGRLFGITVIGGKGYTVPYSGYGVLYAASPNGMFRVVHQFAYLPSGIHPRHLIEAQDGNLFGDAEGGQCSLSVSHGCGVVFEYMPKSDRYIVLHTFDGTTDGSGPMLGSVGADGTLYGATASGGVGKRGTLFSMSPTGMPGHGTYGLSVLVSFAADCRCVGPANPPTLADNGSLVGATDGFLYSYSGGKISVLHLFTGVDIVPGSIGPLLIGLDATIYGQSEHGGVTPCPSASGFPDPNGCGFVFSYSPR